MAQSNGLILVVVVAFGSEDQLIGCLDALGSADTVVVVDNGRTDRTREICSSAGAIYLRSPSNIGFAAAVNLAVRNHRVPGSDVLLLNPDARLDPDNLQALRDQLHQGPEVAAVSPQLVNGDGSPQKVLWPMPSPWVALAGIAGASDRIARRWFLSGAVLLLSSEAIDSIGMLDERFFLYSEEADWQQRAIRAGWRIEVSSGATASHEGGGTSSDASRRELLFNASAERFVRKWYGTSGWLIFRAASMLAATRRLLTSRDIEFRAIQRRSIGHYWRGTGPVSRIRRESSMRIVHVVRSDSFAGVERYISVLAPRVAARGCNVTVIGGERARMAMCSSRVRWWPATTTWEVANKLRRLGRVEIVHAHMTAAELAAVMTWPVHRARLVATLHFATDRGSSLARVPLRQLGRAFDAQIAISHFVAASTTATIVLPNGVEMADPGPEVREPYVLVMQRLEAEKQTEVAIRAWASSGLSKSGWRLVVAGRGSLLDDLRRLCLDLRVSESVDWLGYVADPSDLLARASLLLAPAPAEPFGLTVVEAMARATPVVAADGGAHRETLGDDAYLFPVGDVGACARLLDRTAGSDPAPYGLGLRARQRLLFDIEEHADRLCALYGELVR